MILLLFTSFYRRHTLAVCLSIAAKTCTRAFAVHINVCSRPIGDICIERGWPELFRSPKQPSNIGYGTQASEDKARGNGFCYVTSALLPTLLTVCILQCPEFAYLRMGNC